MLIEVMRGSWQLLNAQERRQAIIVCALVFGGMLFEMVGVGLMVPAIGLMTRPDWHESSRVISALAAPFGDMSQGDFIMIGLAMLVVVYAVKSVYMSLMIGYQCRFVYRVQAELSTRLLARYMSQPWTFHLRRNSAELIRNAQGEVESFFFVLMAVVNLITDAIVAAGLIVFLFAAEPSGSLAITLIFLAAGLAFGRILKHRTERWGALRQRHEVARLKVLQESIGAFRELLLLGRTTGFIERYGAETRALASVQTKHGIAQQLPRVLLELLGVSALAGVVWLLLRQGRSSAEALPAVAMFAAASARLLPAFTRIIASLQMIRWGRPIVRTLQAEIATPAVPERRQEVDMIGPFRTLSLENVSFTYPEAATPSVKDISLELKSGSTTGIVGPSGSGKSTLLDVILGLLPPSAGVVLVNGLDVSAGTRAWHRQIGYVPQTIYLSDDSLRSNIAFGVSAEDVDESSVLRAVKDAQLEDLVASLPSGLDTSVGERGVRLSGGQRQRIGIARALYLDPPVLVLDEATSALDADTERDIMTTIGLLHGTKTIVIVAHRLSTVEGCDEIIRIEAGRIVARGSPDLVLRS